MGGVKVRTLVLSLLAAAVAFAAAGCAHKVSTSSVRQSRTPAYEVLHVGRNPIGQPYYWSVIYDVRVSPATSKDGMVAVSRELLAEAKSGKPFSRVYVLFYDYPEYRMWAGPTLGSVRYGATPGIQVKPGAYDQMTLESRFPTKEWSARPSGFDVRVWSGWEKRVTRQRTRVSARMGERISRAVAVRFGLTVAEVDAILSRCQKWSLPPLGMTD